MKYTPLLRNTPYSDFGPAWIHPAIIQATQAGILPQPAINIDVVSADAAIGAALVQVRRTEFHPRRFARVKKEYFILRQDGLCLPTRAIATTPVAVAIERATA